MTNLSNTTELLAFFANQTVECQPDYLPVLFHGETQVVMTAGDVQAKVSQTIFVEAFNAGTIVLVDRDARLFTGGLQ